MTTRRALLLGLTALAASSAGWTASLHVPFGPAEADLDGDPDGPVIRGLLERQLALWETDDRGALDGMRGTNPEWDFMGRCFLGLALAGLCVAAPGEASRFRAALDRMLADTLATTKALGDRHWLLAYADRAPFHNPGGASLFVDGELASVLLARRLTGGDARWDGAIDDRIARIRAHLDASPRGHGESYPDEGWAFCNAFAALALTFDAAWRGADHTHTLTRWRTGLDALTDPQTGMLISSYTWAGRPLDGPEGSSLFLVLGHLAVLDPELGRAQYALAREHLLRGMAGFGWAREWPSGWRGPTDIDSGPIIPVLDASPGASGLAFVAAAAYDDRPTLAGLLTSLELAGFPTWDGDRLAYAASNAVGDAVLLYALTQRWLRARVRA